MSTKQKTQTQQSTQQQQSFNNNTTFNYDPTALSTYQSNLPFWQQTIQDYMRDPQTATYFNQQVQQAFKNIGLGANMQQGQLYNNLAASGMSGNNAGGFLGDQLAKLSRSTSGQQSNAFTNLLLNANQSRQWATALAGSFQPLQTGVTSSGTSTGTSNMQGTTTQTTGGLGTWLPQVVGAGLSAAMPFMPGMKAASSAGSMFGGGAASAGSGFAGTGMSSGQFFNPGWSNPSTYSFGNVFGMPHP